MSNASNLSTLANVLDDGTSGQFLKSTGSGGVAFADAGGTGVTVHNNQAAMLTDAVSADEGSLHYETANNKLYVKQSSGFFLLASITNTAPTVSGFTETTGSGSATTIADNGTFALTSGSNTVITLTATEPDLETLVYSATVTSGTASNVISSPSLPISNQSGNTFTLTPVTSGSGGTITIRFDVSDGNNVVNKTHSFSIVFQIVDSNYTTLLATATGTSDNNNITDSSSNNHSITVNGDAYAGTFSPYRSGGYSTYFDGSSGGLQIAADSSIAIHTDFTIECWFYLDNNTNGTQAIFSCDTGISSNGLCIQNNNGTNLILRYGGSTKLVDASNVFELERWYHIALTYDQSASTLTLYIDGQQYYQNTSISLGNTTTSYLTIGALGAGYTGYSHVGYIKDFRFSSEVVYSSNFLNPTESLSNTSATEVLTCHLPYISDASTNNHSITQNSTVSTKPFSPYDYAEYSAADHGGSVYLDGNTDTIHTASTHNFANNGFSVSFWYYATLAQGVLFASVSNHIGTIYIAGSLASSVLRYEYKNSGNTNTNYQFISNPEYFSWNYVQVVQDTNGHIRIYMNGNQVGSTITDANMSGASSTAVTIGDWGSSGGSSGFQGYISDFNLTTETSPSTAVPIAPRSSTSNTKLLISGTDASIIDKSQGTNIRLYGSITGNSSNVPSGSSFTGTNSIYLDGDGDGSVPSGDHIRFPMETFDPKNRPYTVEFWFKIPSSISNTSDATLFCSWHYSAGHRQILLSTKGSTKQIKGYYSSSGSDYSSLDTANNVWSYDTWHHFAMVYDPTNGSNGTRTIYIDGSSVNTNTTYTSLHTPDSTIDFVIGSLNAHSGQSWEGYIYDFRIQYKCLYPNNNFTPPSAPLEG